MTSQDNPAQTGKGTKKRRKENVEVARYKGTHETIVEG